MPGLSYRRRPERSKARLWLSLVALLLAAAVLGGPVFFAYRVAHPSARSEESYLAGGDRAVILVPGYGQSGQQIDAAAQLLHGAGHSVMVLGASSHATFGPREAEELVKAVDLVKSRGARQIALMGWGLGANVALKVGAQRPEVGALVLDGPSADPVAMVQQAIREESPLPNLFFGTYTRWMAALLYGVRPGELKPLQEAAQLGARPLLVIAPSAEAGTEILHASGESGSELLVAAEGDSQAYAQKVLAFLARAFEAHK